MLAVLSIIMAVSLVACGDDAPTDDPSPTAPPSTSTPASAEPTATTDTSEPGTDPQYGGRLNFPVGRDPAALDVHQTSGGTDGWILAPITAQLLRSVPNVWTEIEADIASDWEVTEGGAHWTFTIRDNATWHDGEPLTVDDVMYSLNRMYDPPEGSRVGVGASCLIDFAENITQLDDSRVRIELKTPAVSFHTCITKPHVRILPKHIIEPIDQDEDSRDLRQGEMIGSGPFVFAGQERGSHYTYDRFDDYYLEGKPYLDGITYYVMPEASTQLANFIVGTVHIVGMFPGLTPQQAEELQTQMSGEAQVIETQGVGLQGVFLNTASEPFSDVRLRQAAHLAVDRQAIIELIGNGSGYLSPPISPNFGIGYTEEDYLQLPGWRADKSDDIEEAKRLVAEATNGQGLDVTFALRRVVQDLSLVLQQQLAEVDIRVNLEVLEDAILRERAGRGEFSAVVEGSGFQVFDPDGAFLRHFVPGVALNWSQWDDPEFVELYEQQSRAVDRDERDQLIRQISDLMEREVPVVGTASNVGILGIAGSVRNYVPPPAQLDLRFDWIWLDE